ncbi:MAG: alpha/beta fold hydrolase [Actinomycetota bacterium]|nr:alpha/beta fold hydrolase [Actinomycetota bacterium]
MRDGVHAAVMPRRRLANSGTALRALVVATRFLGRWSSALASVPAAILWFTPWRVPVSERGLAKQTRWLDGAETFRIRTRAGRIAVFSVGSGPIVLLVHGWGEQAGALGGFIPPLVARGYRVVGVDLPAHGRSDKGRTNIIQAGRALLGVADRLGPPHAVVAHSMGANVALWALKEGLRTDRLVLLAPNVDLAQPLDVFALMLGLPPKAIAGLTRLIEKRFGRNVWEEIRGDVLARGLSIPAILFHDPNDPQVPFDGSLRLTQVWPSARLVEMPGLGHGGITRAAEVVEQATSFIIEQKERAGSGSLA